MARQLPGGPLPMREMAGIAGFSMTEDCISMEPLDELEETNTRLRLLVCELLLKNQELRTQLSAEEDRLRELLSCKHFGSWAFLGSDL